MRKICELTTSSLQIVLKRGAFNLIAASFHAKMDLDVSHFYKQLELTPSF